MAEPAALIEAGGRAPGFALRHTFERSVDLAQTLERGPVVLVFYVFDFGGY